MYRRNFVRGMGGVAVAGGVASLAGTPATGSTGQVGSTESAPEDLSVLGSAGMAETCEAVVSDDGETVFAATGDGFATVDVSTPAEPTVLATVTDVLGDGGDDPIRELRDVDLDGGLLLAAGPAHSTRGSRGAVAYDVSDPSDPEQVAAHETSYPIHNCHLADGVGYLTGNGATGNPLVTIDAETGEELGRWSLFDVDDAWESVPSKLRMIHDVSITGDLAYVAHWDAGTWILDVSDPAAPSVVSRVRGRSPETLAAVEAVDDDYISLPGNDHSAVTDESGTLLGICEEAWSADDPNAGADAHGRLVLYDVSDPTAPERLTRIDPPPTSDPTRGGNPTTAHNFEFADGLCYSSWYEGGVRVHDVADPANPVELAAWRDDDRASIWTAQAGVPGEFFVASIREVPGDVDAEQGILTFPDVRDGDGGTATPTPTPAGGDDDPTPTPSGGDDDQTPTEDGGGGDETPREDDGSGDDPTPTPTPEGAGDQPTASPTPGGGDGDPTPTDDDREQPTPTPTPDGDDSDADDTEDPNPSDPDEGTEGGGAPDVSIGTGDVFAVPGVGLLVGAGALGLGALRRYRRSE